MHRSKIRISYISLFVLLLLVLAVLILQTSLNQPVTLALAGAGPTAFGPLPYKASPEGVDQQIYLPVVNKNSVEGLPPNLIQNGTFESGTLGGWQAEGATAFALEAHSGNWAARVPGNMETIIQTDPGQAYKVMAWIKIAGQTGDDWGGFRLEALDWEWESLAHSGWLLSDAYGNDWFKIALTFTAMTSRTRLHVGYFGGPDRTMDVYVDDLYAFNRGVNLAPDVVASLTPAAIPELPQIQNYTLIGDDPDGAIVRVVWDFGDGTRSLSASGSRRVPLPGDYMAVVRVADDEGAVTVKTIDWSAAHAGKTGLVVNTPAAYESTVNNGTLSLAGTAAGDTTGLLVSSDRGYTGGASGTTAWQAEVLLKPGLNRILIQAHGANGRLSAVERLVRFVPANPLSIAGIVEHETTVEQWEVLEINFLLENSAATHPQFPYDPSPPPGLEWSDGVTVDAIFTPDNGQTVYRRPAFLQQRYETDLRDGQEWLYPLGTPVWTVRFAPPHTGTWKYRLEATEAKGTAQSSERQFEVSAPTRPANHGPVRVSTLDSRYFEFADGTPFLGTGHGIAFSDESYAYDAVATFDEIGPNNQNFFRWWIAGHLWGSAWQPWFSRTLGYEGTVPATGLTLDRAYGDGLASLKLDSINPIMFQGFMSGRTGLIPGRTYRLAVRWRTEDVTGPAGPGEPFGVTVKFTGWPEPGQTSAIPPVIPHVAGDTPWHTAYSDFVAEEDFVPNLALILENTTGGTAYIDEIDMYELGAGGELGPQLLRSPGFNSHLAFDPRRGAGMDSILAEAATRGLYFKLVISEKQEYLLNHLGPDGLPDRNGSFFNSPEGSPTHRLHQYYWRHLFARFGAYRSVHSWELVNEEAPQPGSHFVLTAELARLAAADGNPHPATTSTWATLAEDAWTDPDSRPISYVDFHAYVNSTGWLEPKETLANDSARFFHEYDLAALEAGFGKPVVWGEQGIDGPLSTDEQEPLLADDPQGVWLHKLTWARCGPGGVYPIYWYTDLIFENSLHPIFGAWSRFMADVPLNNGQYQDVAATTNQPHLRVLGQKDVHNGRAHVWIDNRQHTWRAVVEGDSIPEVSGSVSIPLARPGVTYTVVEYDTVTGQPDSTQTLSANAAGNLLLDISNLKTDTAFKISLNTN